MSLYGISEHSHPLDLSDEGLVADLEKRGSAGVEQLVLNADDKNHKKREE